MNSIQKYAAVLLHVWILKLHIYSWPFAITIVMFSFIDKDYISVQGSTIAKDPESEPEEDTNCCTGVQQLQSL